MGLVVLLPGFAYLKDQYGMTGTEIMLPLAVLYSPCLAVRWRLLPYLFINKGYNAYDGRMSDALIAVIPLVVAASHPWHHIGSPLY
jgi:ACS family hexuronate transporter-like MFS transporter